MKINFLSTPIIDKNQRNSPWKMTEFIYKLKLQENILLSIMSGGKRGKKE